MPPTFLSREDVYAVLQRELPEGAYPGGPPSGSFSGADLGAVSKVVETAEDNLEQIYDNYSPQFADSDATTQNELLYLGQTLPGTLSLQERRNRVVAKIRTRRRTTPKDLEAVAYTVVDSSVPVEVVELGCSGGSWILDESELEISTYLSGWYGGQFLFRSDWCTVTAAELGITEQDYQDYRSEVYTYEVRIYGYTLTAQERTDLDKALTKAEPSRSLHVIVDGLDPADEISGDT